jgi:hypothetical protein
MFRFRRPSRAWKCFFGNREGKWMMTEFVGMDAVCRFAHIDCAIPLAAIYEGIELDVE